MGVTPAATVMGHADGRPCPCCPITVDRTIDSSIAMVVPGAIKKHSLMKTKGFSRITSKNRMLGANGTTHCCGATDSPTAQD
jgi:hypothetical protein